MNNTYFLGIDIGTYESKGVLINKDYEVVASHSEKHELENPKPGYFEHDAEAVWWGDFCKISRALIQKAGINAEEIACVGTSALGADCVAVDENCKPLHKAILYGIDSRAEQEMAYLNDYYGEEKINQLFGRPLCSSDVAPKILWIKNNLPEVYEKTYKFLTATSYITAKLTDEYVIDKFLVNTFTPAYRQDGSTDEDLCQLYCRADQLATCKSTLDVVGKVTQNAARETGLKEGTPVLTGTDDAGAESISTGVFQPGDMMIMLGSSCYMIYCSEKLVVDQRLWHDSFIIPGTYSVSAGTNTAGTLTRWFRDHIYFDHLENQEESGVNAYESMLEGLEEIPPGSDGLITLPYFAGERTPINDPLAKGVIFGLKLNHTRKHMYRSALEGVAYSIAQHLDILREYGLPLNKVMAVGGGSKNKIWLQMIADASNQEIQTAKVTIGAAYGDALMAAIGVGICPGFDSLSGYIQPAEVFTPNEQAHSAYEPFREMFSEIYTRNKDLMHSL